MSSGPQPGESAFIEFIPMRPSNGRAPGTPRPASLPREALGEWGADGAVQRRVAVPLAHPAPAPTPAPTPAPQRDTRSGYQDAWLNRMRHDGALLDLRCLDGTVLSGRLLQFDTFSLILEDAQGPYLVFKHAVATIRPQITS